jgi:hypothetical protein
MYETLNRIYIYIYIYFENNTFFSFIMDKVPLEGGASKVEWVEVNVLYRCVEWQRLQANKSMYVFGKQAHHWWKYKNENKKQLVRLVSLALIAKKQTFLSSYSQNQT